MKWLTVWCFLILSGVFSMAAPPRVMVQSGSQDVYSGDSFCAYVTTWGESVTYQWYKGEDPLSGETEASLLLEDVSLAEAGAYHVVATNPDGLVSSDAVSLTVKPLHSFDIAPGSNGTVYVRNSLCYYELYLPSTYGSSPGPFPILFTNWYGGGGMINHFRTVAEENQWIVVGVSQSRNGNSAYSAAMLTRGVYDHALKHLKADPRRVFTAGMSGGAVDSFYNTKIYSPIMAGVLSMGGWLGDAHSRTRDLFLSGLLVARATGDSDSGAKSRIAVDRTFMQNWLAPDDIVDWFFPGGHVAAPESIQREIFDWWLSRTQASTAEELQLAQNQEAVWRARISAGDCQSVYGEVLNEAFHSPRTSGAMAAFRAMDFLFSRYHLFLGEGKPDFPEDDSFVHYRAFLYHNLWAYMHDRDPSRQMSAVAAMKSAGSWSWSGVMAGYEQSNILRHVPHTVFDAYVLENGLYVRSELPLVGDWDGDGRNNFSEFALGTDPLVADAPWVVECHKWGEAMHFVLPKCVMGPWSVIAVEESNGLGTWQPASSGSIWSQPFNEGYSCLSYLVEEAPSHLFVRYKASLGNEDWDNSGKWEDPNNDGIPYLYHSPSVYSYGGEYPDSPDVRMEEEVPGGPPLYLRYLTAANTGRDSGDFEDEYYRYHPALAGYNGYLYHETWMGVSGTNVSDATATLNSRPPDDVRLMKTTQPAWHSGNETDMMGSNYFERSRGYVVPDVTGDYQFSIAGDNQCELWLSTSEDSAAKVLIARVSGYTAYHDFDASTEQISASMTLQAGQAYYVEILHKKSGGGGHVAVAWASTSDPNWMIIQSQNLRCLSLSEIEATALSGTSFSNSGSNINGGNYYGVSANLSDANWVVQGDPVGGQVALTELTLYNRSGSDSGTNVAAYLHVYNDSGAFVGSSTNAFNFRTIDTNGQAATFTFDHLPLTTSKTYQFRLIDSQAEGGGQVRARMQVVQPANLANSYMLSSGYTGQDTGWDARYTIKVEEVESE